MIDRERALAKIATIDRCLARIADVRGVRRKDLLPVDAEDIASLNLQRAIQAAVDLATHIVSTEGYVLHSIPGFQPVPVLPGESVAVLRVQ